MGTGSGILGIMALKLGAKAVTAVDIDANAVKIAKENADLNGVGEAFCALFGNAGDPAFSEQIGKDYDIITANIVADVIISAADLFYDKLKADGILITSGIIGPRVKEVESALQKSGFEIEKVETKNDWAAIFAKKRK